MRYQYTFDPFWEINLDLASMTLKLLHAHEHNRTDRPY